MSDNNRSELRQMGELYFEYLGYTHKSPTTISVRRRYLNYFFTWCEERSLERLEDFSRPIIESYQKYLFHYRKKNNKALSINGQQSRLVAIRGFFKYLAKNRYILHNPAADIEMPRKSVRLPRSILSQKEVEQILNQVDIKSDEGIRDRAILEVFYATGIRRAELCGLKVYDYDCDRGVLMIREGKGRKDRVVPLGQRAEEWLQLYLSEVREKFLFQSAELALFLSINGTAIPLQSLTESMRRYIKQAGIDKKGACHIFRHTVATLMLENGADIRYIQQMLGHADLESTKIYTHVSIKQLKNVHNLTHPANLKTSPEDSQKSDPSES